MKLVMEQYASGVIAVLVAVVVLAVVMGSSTKEGFSLRASMGDIIEESLPDEEWQNSRGAAFAKCKDNILPTIALETTYELLAGVSLDINSIMTGVEKDGEKISVVVVQGWTEDFEETSLNLSTDTDFVCVENPGIYWMLAETTDSKGNTRQSMVKLLVNER